MVTQYEWIATGQTTYINKFNLSSIFLPPTILGADADMVTSYAPEETVAIKTEAVDWTAIAQSADLRGLTKSVVQMERRTLIIVPLSTVLV